VEGSFAKLHVQHLVHIEDAVGKPVFEWLCQDGIAIMVVHSHDVADAIAGGSGEFAHLVHVDLAKWLKNGGKV